VTLDTKFAIASTAKMFEAVAALQLIEAGRLRLDDTVGRYIPEYENKEVASKVTIRHLLLHTGGTGGVPPEDVRKTLRTVGDYVLLLSPRPPLFDPGSEYQYSNFGYVLLAALIERVSGLPFEAYVQQRIFTPAGMRSTSIGVPSQPDPSRALGYSRQKGELVRVVNQEPFPAFSTARDLLSFARALQAGTLISSAMLKEATSLPPTGQRYGYGLMLWEHGSVESIGHGGTSAGVNADMRIVLRSGYVCHRAQ
jgi:CubicO group peptidase (beta-lactamase class C family)